MTAASFDRMKNKAYSQALFNRMCGSYIPDSKVYEANMGPTWDLSSPGEPYVGPMSLAARVYYKYMYTEKYFFYINW